MINAITRHLSNASNCVHQDKGFVDDTVQPMARSSSHNS